MPTKGVFKSPFGVSGLAVYVLMLIAWTIGVFKGEYGLGVPADGSVSGAVIVTAVVVVGLSVTSFIRREQPRYRIIALSCVLLTPLFMVIVEFVPWLYLAASSLLGAELSRAIPFQL